MITPAPPGPVLYSPFCFVLSPPRFLPLRCTAFLARCSCVLLFACFSCLLAAALACCCPCSLLLLVDDLALCCCSPLSVVDLACCSSCLLRLLLLLLLLLAVAAAAAAAWRQLDRARVVLQQWLHQTLLFPGVKESQVRWHR